MRRIARHRLALLVPAFFLFRLAYFAIFGVLTGHGAGAIVDALLVEVRQYTLASLLLFVALCRPTGSGALVAGVSSYAFEGRTPDCESIDCRQAALEAVGLVLGVVGAVGVTFFAAVPGRYVNRHSLAEAFAVRTVFGLDANAFYVFLVAGVVLWGLAWVVDGLSLSTDPVYRQSD